MNLPFIINCALRPLRSARRICGRDGRAVACYSSDSPTAAPLLGSRPAKNKKKRQKNVTSPLFWLLICLYNKPPSPKDALTMKKHCILLIFSLLCITTLLQAQPAKPGDGKKTTTTDNAKKLKKEEQELIKDNTKVKIKQEKNAVYMQMDSAYKQRIMLSEIDGIYIPKDLNDCFRQLDKLMEPDVRKNFLEFSDEEVDKRTHGSLGKWIEHKWSLKEGSRLSHYFNTMQVPHPDYMVGIIIRSYHRHLHKRDIQLKEQVLEFREMWQKKQRARAKEMLKENGK